MSVNLISPVDEIRNRSTLSVLKIKSWLFLVPINFVVSVTVFPPTVQSSLSASTWIRGFSQNQYSIGLQTMNNFYFSWSAVVVRVKGKIFLGISEQIYAPIRNESQVLFAPMISLKLLPFVLEFFLYNFGKRNNLYAIGCQYFF
jgi:hypothetical protein